MRKNVNSHACVKWLFSLQKETTKYGNSLTPNVIGNIGYCWW